MSAPTGAPAAPDAAPLTHRQILVVFSGLMAGMLLASLDQTIVSTALPTIVGELGGVEHLSWVVTAYLLTTTASTPLYGKLSDLYGRKLLFQAAIVIFLAGSLLAGLAQDMLQLIVFRGIQGIGGGGLMAMAFAIIGDVVPPRERGRYTGYLGAVFAVSSVAGPLLGGFFVDNLGWRWVFTINVPVGIAALVVTSSALDLPFTRRDHEVDYAGAGLLVGGVTGLLLALVWGGNEYAWGSPQIVGLLGAAAALLAVFVWWELRVAEPILPMRLFSGRTFAVGTAVSFVIGCAMFGGIVFLPLFLQVVTGASATNSGLLLLPFMLGIMATSILSGRVIARTGRYRAWPIAGTMVATVGMLLFSRMDADTGRGFSALAMVVFGIGIGMVMQVLVLAVQNAAEPRDLGVVTSAVNFFRSLGGSVGVAVFGAIFASRLGSELAARVPADAVPAGLSADALVNSPDQIAALPSAVQQGVVESLAAAIHTVFVWAVPLVAVGAVLAWLLDEHPLRETANVRPSAVEGAEEALAGGAA